LFRITAFESDEEETKSRVVLPEKAKRFILISSNKKRIQSNFENVN
jgi:hypothetical protein